ncbi:MAG: hypothetical protein R3181_02640 [Rubricoccaceae bacterium]|nr:hypothetical protein [Rubricoccaceae bacterium]
MRTLLALAAALLLVPTLRAQPTSIDVPDVRRGGEGALMGLAGLTAGVAAAALLGSTLDGAGAPPEVMAPLALVAYPAGVAAGVYGTGRLLGLDGSFRSTLGDAALGTAVGVGAGAAVLLVYSAVADPEASSSVEDVVVTTAEFLAVAALAGGIAVSVPVIWAVRGVQAAPALARAPTGEAVAGVALRLRF